MKKILDKTDANILLAILLLLVLINLLIIAIDNL